jgi:hypothetical protein
MELFHFQTLFPFQLPRESTIGAFAESAPTGSHSEAGSSQTRACTWMTSPGGKNPRAAGSRPLV